MAENISKIILNGTEYVIKDAATQYHTINGQQITGGTGDIVITGGSGLKKWEGTRAEYNALGTYDENTIYVITDENVEYALKSDLDKKQDKGDYALKSEIPTVPSKVSAFQNDAGYLTEHQDISNLATKNELSTKQDKGNYALKTDIPVVPSKVSAFQNDAGYLTEHQDISGLATKTELNGKQDALVSGTNLKTINGQSILGNGDITINAGATLPISSDNVNYTDSTSSTKTLTQVLNNTEEITFTLEDGSTVTKKFILG